MTTLLVTGDLHWRGSTPVGRVDDFQQALAKKLYEIQRISADYACDAVVIPGDLFDSPSASYSVTTRLAKILKAFNCPIYTVPGNHDIYGGNLGSIERTPYGLLAGLHIIRNAAANPFKIAENTVICGRGFCDLTDRDIAYTYGRTQNDHNEILITHGMLLERSPGYEMRSTTIDQLAEADLALPRVLICGHYHLGLPIQEVGECLIISPGALCRLSAHPAEIERQPQVVVVDIDQLGGVVYETIPLKSARPGHEVLSREHLEAAARREAQTQHFLSLIADEGKSQYMEIRDIAETIAQRENLPQSVVDEALARLAQAGEKLGSAIAKEADHGRHTA